MLTKTLQFLPVLMLVFVGCQLPKADNMDGEVRGTYSLKIGNEDHYIAFAPGGQILRWVEDTSGQVTFESGGTYTVYDNGLEYLLNVTIPQYFDSPVYQDFVTHKEISYMDDITNWPTSTRYWKTTNSYSPPTLDWMFIRSWISLGSPVVDPLNSSIDFRFGELNCYGGSYSSLLADGFISFSLAGETADTYIAFEKAILIVDDINRYFSLYPGYHTISGSFYAVIDGVDVSFSHEYDDVNKVHIWTNGSDILRYSFKFDYVCNLSTGDWSIKEEWYNVIYDY